MSAAAAAEPGRDTPTRLIWLTGHERATLCEAIEAHLAAVTCLPNVADALASLMLELNVVEARDLLSPNAAAITRHIGRMTRDCMPMRVSADELRIAGTLPNLPPDLFDRLHLRRP